HDAKRPRASALAARAGVAPEAPPAVAPECRCEISTCGGGLFFRRTGPAARAAVHRRDAGALLQPRCFPAGAARSRAAAEDLVRGCKDARCAGLRRQLGIELRLPESIA